MLQISVAVGLWALLVLLSGIQGSGVQISGTRIPGVLVVPRSVLIFDPTLGAAFVWGTRQAAGWLLKRASIELPVRFREKACNALIHGQRPAACGRRGRRARSRPQQSQGCRRATSLIDRDGAGAADPA